MKLIKRQSGAVSLFVVIFSTLLITVVTVSFLRIMITDQNKASSNDLSQSAYDSALAGVEDAKRALLRYQKVCNDDGRAACDALALQLATTDCNSALRIGGIVPSGDGEVLVQQTSSTNDAKLDQAYTCVILKLRTDDFIGTLSAGQSKIVPLVAKNTDGSNDYNSVQIEWFSIEDISSSGAYEVDLPEVSVMRVLPLQAEWPANRPSILRTQLMQFGDSFRLTDFDATSGSRSNTNTLFLYPTSMVTAGTQNFVTRDTRASSVGETPPADQRADTPLPVNCRESLSTGGYACSVKLNLPQPVGGGDRTAYLRIGSLYNSSHFRVTMYKNGVLSKFDGVQPEVDSTGRANDLFRRVVNRVELIDNSFPYPDGALNTSGNLCKDFAVTDTTAGYTPGLCTP